MLYQLGLKIDFHFMSHRAFPCEQIIEVSILALMMAFCHCDLSLTTHLDRDPQLHWRHLMMLAKPYPNRSWCDLQSLQSDTHLGALQSIVEPAVLVLWLLSSFRGASKRVSEVNGILDIHNLRLHGRVQRHLMGQHVKSLRLHDIFPFAFFVE